MGGSGLAAVSPQSNSGRSRWTKRISRLGDDPPDSATAPGSARLHRPVTDQTLDTARLSQTKLQPAYQASYCHAVAQLERPTNLQRAILGHVPSQSDSGVQDA